jgi:hypothetical protein
MSKENTNPQEPTLPAQKATLERLCQGAAALLIGKTSRWLRDRPDAPRNADGTYNAFPLLSWKASLDGGSVDVDLDDGDQERLMRIVENLHFSWDAQAVAAVDQIEDMIRRHGRGVLPKLMAMLWGEWTLFAEFHRNCPPQQEHDDSRFHRDASQHLREAVVCNGCRRMRHGSKWIKTAIPADHTKVGDYCPECLKKLQAD